MELYKYAKIVSIGKTYVIIESNFVGTILYVANPNDWEEEKDKNKKVFIYKHKTEYIEATYGFKTFAERILFEDLLSVNGIGPKTALSALREGETSISSLIAGGNAKALAEIPYLGIKSANQIIFELKPKYEKRGLSKVESITSIDLRLSLKTLGFNPRQIDFAVQRVNLQDGPIEKLVEESIKVISNAKSA